jgi:phosphohistidine phosphatase
MHIYLMRHAEAVSPNDWTGPDKTRPLSESGISALKAALQHMRRQRLSADALLTSPYRRANQTADMVAEELHVLQTLQRPELAAGARLDAFKKMLGENLGANSLWIVGHMPELSAFASQLTGDPADLERGFTPGEVLAVECSVDARGPESGIFLFRRRLDQWKAA